MHPILFICKCISAPLFGGSPTFYTLPLTHWLFSLDLLEQCFWSRKCCYWKEISLPSTCGSAFCLCKGFGFWPWCFCSTFSVVAAEPVVKNAERPWKFFCNWGKSLNENLQRFLLGQGSLSMGKLPSLKFLRWKRMLWMAASVGLLWCMKFKECSFRFCVLYP